MHGKRRRVPTHPEFPRFLRCELFPRFLRCNLSSTSREKSPYEVRRKFIHLNGSDSDKKVTKISHSFRTSVRESRVSIPRRDFSVGEQYHSVSTPVSNITNVSSNRPEGVPLEGYVSAFGAPSPTNANAIVVHVTSNDGFLCATSGGVFTQPTGLGSSNACNGAFVPGSGFLKSVTMTPCLSLTVDGAPCWGFRNFQFGVSKGGPAGQGGRLETKPRLRTRGLPLFYYGN